MTDYSSILMVGLAIVSLFGVLNLIAAWWLISFVMEKHSEHSWRIVRAIRLVVERSECLQRKTENQGPAYSEAEGTSQCTLQGSSLNSPEGLSESKLGFLSDKEWTSFKAEEAREIEWIEIPAWPGTTFRIRKNLLGKVCS